MVSTAAVFSSANKVCSRVVVAQTLCPSRNPKGSSHKGLKKDCLTRSMLSSDTRGRPALFPLQRHPVAWNCWYQLLVLLGEGESLLNCRRNARCTETTDSRFANCSTQNAFCFRVAIIVLLRHRPREKRGVGLGMRTCCFVPCGKLTNACVFKAVMADWNRSNHFDTSCIRTVCQGLKRRRWRRTTTKTTTTTTRCEEHYDHKTKGASTMR